MVTVVARALELAAVVLMMQGNGAPTLLADSTRRATTDSAPTITVGGFIDTYYAYDQGRPPLIDRVFTTQAARHGEFNVNLAFLEAVANGPRLRGRLAVQMGTSVQANYSSEPQTGEYSGPDLSQLIQEAYVGVRVRPSLWIDGGIFFSNVGMEGWISRDNPIYTRSLVADLSPYYSSGVRAHWTPASHLSIRVDLVNGWQKISEDNDTKSVGVRVEYAMTAATTLVYYGLAGTEGADQQRAFHGVGFRSAFGNRLELMGQVDVGRQRQPSVPNMAAHRMMKREWNGAMLIGRMRVTSSTSVVGRLERFADPNQVIAVSPTAGALRASGGSLGFEVAPAPRLLWRHEARMLTNADAIFPDRGALAGFSRRNVVWTSAVALTF